MCEEECIKWVFLLPSSVKHAVTFIPKTETYEGKSMTLERVLYLRCPFSAPSPPHTHQHAHARVCELHMQSYKDVKQSLIGSLRSGCWVLGKQEKGVGGSRRGRAACGALLRRGWGVQPCLEAARAGHFTGCWLGFLVKKWCWRESVSRTSGTAWAWIREETTAQTGRTCFLTRVIGHGCRWTRSVEAQQDTS